MTTTVDEYLAALPDDKRTALERLRAQIRAAAPEATEGIAYQMPAFRLKGRFLVSYAAFRDHCSLYPGTAHMAEILGDEITPYMAGKGTLRFDPASPLPAELVAKIVKLRIEEVEAEAGARKR